MAILGVCPNPECGADLMIPKRIGARVTCDECGIEWEVEDYDPVELIAIDEEEEWGLDVEEEDDLDLAGAGRGRGGALAGVGAVAATREVTQTQWECSECGMIEVGPRPPRKCAGCGATGDHFAMLAIEEESPFDEPEEDEEF